MITDQLALALADRHAGQQANLAANQTGHRDDRSRVEEVVARIARSGAAFTADAIHAQLADGPAYDRNLVSSVMGIWAQRGHIVEITDRPAIASTARTRRASRNRWWRGNNLIPEARRG